MIEIFEKAGFFPDKQKLELFEKYYKILTFYNEKFNLTAITEKNDVYIKHFVDSLTGAKFINGDFLDVGSGGGFPALPLKIYKPEIKATLLEATGKKCEFLREVIKELGLKNTEVICGRAEDLAHDKFYREKFEFCTARAVAALPVLLEYCLPFLKVNGKFVAYKGDAEQEISDAKNALKVLGGGIEKIEKIDLFGNTRTVIVINKENKTPEEYPRCNAKIRKKPL